MKTIISILSTIAPYTGGIAAACLCYVCMSGSVMFLAVGIVLAVLCYIGLRSI